MANHPTDAVTSASMPVTTGQSEQIALRLPHDYIKRAEAIGAAIAEGSEREAPSRSEVLRLIFVRGLEALEARHKIKPAKPENGGHKPARAKR